MDTRTIHAIEVIKTSIGLLTDTTGTNLKETIINDLNLITPKILATDYIVGLCVAMSKQENRATQYPIFEVRDYDRVYGDDLASSDGSIWVCDDDPELYFETSEELNKYLDEDDTGYGEFDFTEREYAKVVRVNSWYFTEEAADQDIRAKSHHYDEPFTYVNSAYGNFEIINLVQSMFKMSGLELPVYWR